MASDNSLPPDKRVLFIAHMFPPVGGPGVQRSAKFVKYLPQFGWQPTVLTSRYSSRWEEDETLLNDIPPGTEILRTYSWEECNGPLSPFRYVNTPFSIPDRANLWFPWAFSTALKRLRQGSFNAIYATGYPYSSLILAALLKGVSGLPLVADFRDEWTLDPDYRMDQSPHRRLFLPLERLQQRWVINRADKIIVVTESAREAFIREYGDLPQLTVLRNGYDSSDFVTASKPCLAPEKFHIVHTGNTFRPVVKRPDTFLAGLNLALKQSASLRNNIQVWFVGEMDAVSKSYVAELDMKQYVNPIRYLPHPQSVGYLLDADVLLLISRDYRVFDLGGLSGKVPGKVYEYIGSERPVLVLAPRNSEPLKLFEKAGTAFWADPEDIEAIAKMILHLEDLWKRGRLTTKPDSEFIRTFSREYQTGQLAQILNETSQ